MNQIDLLLNIPHTRFPDIEECITAANSGIGQGDEEWRLLWRDPMQQEHLQSVEATVQSLLPCKNLLVIGIGGSALGAIALHTALCESDSISFYVLDNIDPFTLQKVLRRLRVQYQMLDY